LESWRERWINRNIERESWRERERESWREREMLDAKRLKKIVMKDENGKRC